jgi:hypothetical protein
VKSTAPFTLWDPSLRWDDDNANPWRNFPNLGGRKSRLPPLITEYSAVFRHFLHLARPL